MVLDCGGRAKRRRRFGFTTPGPSQDAATAASALRSAVAVHKRVFQADALKIWLQISPPRNRFCPLLKEYRNFYGACRYDQVCWVQIYRLCRGLSRRLLL